MKTFSIKQPQSNTQHGDLLHRYHVSLQSCDREACLPPHGNNNPTVAMSPRIQTQSQKSMVTNRLHLATHTTAAAWTIIIIIHLSCFKTESVPPRCLKPQWFQPHDVAVSLQQPSLPSWLLANHRASALPGEWTQCPDIRPKCLPS